MAVKSETLGQCQSMLMVRRMCDLDEEGRLFSQSLTTAQKFIENVSKRPFISFWKKHVLLTPVIKYSVVVMVVNSEVLEGKN